jgi:hypothetical protein
MTNFSINQSDLDEENSICAIDLLKRSGMTQSMSIGRRVIMQNGFSYKCPESNKWVTVDDCSKRIPVSDGTLILIGVRQYGKVSIDNGVA